MSGTVTSIVLTPLEAATLFAGASDLGVSAFASADSGAFGFGASAEVSAGADTSGSGAAAPDSI